MLANYNYHVKWAFNHDAPVQETMHDGLPYFSQGFLTYNQLSSWGLVLKTMNETCYVFEKGCMQKWTS